MHDAVDLFRVNTHTHSREQLRQQSCKLFGASSFCNQCFRCY